MSISLDDIACLLGLSVMEKSVRLPIDLEPLLVVDLLVSYLGVSHCEVRDELNTEGGTPVCLDWLKDRFRSIINNDPEVRIMCVLRPYL